MNNVVQLFEQKSTCYESKEQLVQLYGHEIKKRFNPNDRIIIKEKDFFASLQNKTFGILDCIPFEEKNCVYSGGSLYDIITMNTLNKVDLDIFLYGDLELQKGTIKKILINLCSKFTVYPIIEKNFINIYIHNIPLTVQIICTNYDHPDKIINSFDCSYVKSYYDGTTVYSSLDCVDSLLTQSVKIYGVKKLVRLYKIINRNLDIVYNGPIYTSPNCIPVGSKLSYYDIIRDPGVIEHKTNKIFPNDTNKDVFINNVLDSDIDAYLNDLNPLHCQYISSKNVNIDINNVEFSSNKMDIMPNIFTMYSVLCDKKEFTFVIENAKLSTIFSECHGMRSSYVFSLDSLQSRDLLHTICHNTKTCATTMVNLTGNNNPVTFSNTLLHKYNNTYEIKLTENHINNFSLLQQDCTYDLEIKLYFGKHNMARSQNQNSEFMYCPRLKSFTRTDNYSAKHEVVKYFYDVLQDIIIGYL